VKRITSAVAALDEKASLGRVRDALAAGGSPSSVVSAAEAGMRIVGERYERQEIFLSGLIMAGEIFRGIMELAQPGLESELAGGDSTSGRVLLGTVAGDIHDIGKNMASLAFRTFGFTVHDLGVNVPPERFVEAAREFHPDIIGLSGLISVAFNSMRQTVSLLRDRASDFSPAPITLIGGGTIDEVVARWVGADHWTTDAMEGVRLCQRLMNDPSVAGVSTLMEGR
jgi:methanogenic corrinoid protein MtbC1